MADSDLPDVPCTEDAAVICIAYVAEGWSIDIEAGVPITCVADALLGLDVAAGVPITCVADALLGLDVAAGVPITCVTCALLDVAVDTQ